MKNVRFIANMLLALILFVFAAILTPPTIKMVQGYHGKIMGPGALPAVCLIGIVGLMIFIVIKEVRTYLRTRHDQEPADEALVQFGLPLREFMTRSLIGLALLWIYIFLWRYTHFLFATILFCMSLSAMLMTKEKNSTKKIITTSCWLIGCVVFIWYCFAELLLVPLR